MNIRWDMIIGGLGLFLFGIKYMGDGLKSAAGDKLRDYIDKYTSNPLMGVLIGAFLTVLIQSSSATSAITIGLVRAGLMKLEQAAGIVMGANIGTTVTAFMIGLKVEKFSLYFIFIGAILLTFASNKKFKYFGEIILGFGALFYGLMIMGDALKELMMLPQFKEITDAMSTQPTLALMAGVLLTALIQSSSAMIGIVQKTYEAGGMSLIVAIGFVFGSNIGTTITGVLAAIGGSVAAKRTALFNSAINIVAAFVGMILINPYVNLITSISKLLNLNPMMEIAFVHIIFNLSAIIILLPFINKLCNLTKSIIKGKDNDQIEINLSELDENTLAHTSPATALSLALSATDKLNDIVVNNVRLTQNFLNSKKKSAEDGEIIRQNENLIDSLDKKITHYLMKISSESLTDSSTSEVNLYLQTIKNLERIGDITINLLEFFEMVNEDKANFSSVATNEINHLIDTYYKMQHLSHEILFTKNINLYDELLNLESQLDTLEYSYRKNHFKRMYEGECPNAIAGSVYCDILSNIERMGDHCCNIAKIALGLAN